MLTGLQLHAQSPFVGVQFAPNVAELQGAGVPLNAQPKVGITAGGFANIPLNEAFSVESELLYTNKGARFDEGVADYSVNMDYIQIPVLAQVGFGDKENIRFYGNAGPYFGLLVGATREGEISTGTNPFNGSTTTATVDEKVQGAMNDWDFGISGSIGVHFPFYNGRLKLSLRYSKSLPQIQTSDEAEVLVNQQEGPIQNSVILLNAGYGLNLTD